MSFSPRKIDFFHPYIVAILILVILAMGYIGSFNYRFKDPLNSITILTVIFAAAVFTVGVFIASKKYTIEKNIEVDYISEKILVIFIIIA